ncbi:MAG: ribose-phosphate diphosphokinase [Nitrososphaeraceae archaeon]
MSNEVIISGPSSIKLAENISNLLNINLVYPELKIFDDGESRIRINGISNKNCIIVQSLYPPVDRHIMQLLMIVQKCKIENAEKITAIIPYMAYARQDKVFQDGEIISIALLSKLLKSLGVDKIITIDIHNEISETYFSMEFINISAIPTLAKYIINNYKLKDPIVVSPDKGGLKRAQKFADIIKSEVTFLKKTRDRNTGKVIMEDRTDTNFENKDILLVDDMISTGSSIIEACKILKQKNVHKIYVICTHALFLNNALPKIKDIGINNIISTNSIPNECGSVDISQIISETI